MIVAVLYRVPPCGHTKEPKCKECGIQSLDWIERMLCVLNDKSCELFARSIIALPDDLTWEEIEKAGAENIKQPLTELEQQHANKLKERFRPYQGKTLVVGSREYSIYDANSDFLPCGGAPSIELTDEETTAWKAEFERFEWIPFNDDLFLK
jgi:hypothetical protein